MIILPGIPLTRKISNPFIITPPMPISKPTSGKVEGKTIFKVFLYLYHERSEGSNFIGRYASSE
jgi:hypothetical protein